MCLNRPKDVLGRMDLRLITRESGLEITDSYFHLIVFIFFLLMFMFQNQKTQKNFLVVRLKSLESLRLEITYDFLLR